MNSYKIRINRVLVNWLLLPLISGVIVLYLYHKFSNEESLLIIALLITWVSYLLYITAKEVKRPSKIIINEEKIKFVGLFGSQEYDVSALHTIKTAYFKNELKFDFFSLDVVVHVDNEINNLHKLINELKTINTNIETFGC